MGRPGEEAELMETFVVRVWVSPREGAHGEPDVPRGVVQHVRSGRSSSFGGASELIEFLRATATAPSTELERRC
jgi:hypothetical protein